MEKAQSLLQNEDLTITEIADRLGYQSIAYFSRAFKRSHGISPSEYRKQWASPASGSQKRVLRIGEIAHVGRHPTH